MLIRYGCTLSVVVERATPTFCLVDIHPDRRHDIVREQPLHASPSLPLATTADAFGNALKRCVLPPGETNFVLDGMIADAGSLDVRDPNARALPVTDLPGEVATYLNGSRYCETDKLGAVAWGLFGDLLPGTQMVQAICDFAHERVAFDYQQARSTRTAVEAYEERVGVCRDFTHLAITLCRCMNIPARYVNGYLGDIGVPPHSAPMDFNAWFEVYLDGRWFTFDARHNTRRIGRLPIARGRDACDVPMIQTFGPHVLSAFRVMSEEISELQVRAACYGPLRTTPSDAASEIAIPVHAQCR
jgi:transglutaminase-like putative cysteine protease